jgi:hypothetical protein
MKYTAIEKQYNITQIYTLESHTTKLAFNEGHHLMFIIRVQMKATISLEKLKENGF